MYDDQTIFWLILRTIHIPQIVPLPECPRETSMLQNVTVSSAESELNTVTSCPLDNCLFSASHLRDYKTYKALLQRLKTRSSPAVMVHANWINGDDMKKAALARSGLWITREVKENSQESSDDVDPKPQDRADSEQQSRGAAPKPKSKPKRPNSVSSTRKKKGASTNEMSSQSKSNNRQKHSRTNRVCIEPSSTLL